MFMVMGALAGTVGSFLKEYQTAVNIVSGVIVVFFGLSFLGVIKLSVFKGTGLSAKTDNLGFFSSLLFGMIFSIGWTPCVGAFLGSALMLASQQGHVAEGILMLFTYSLGLGIPFMVSAVLIDRLKTAFDWIKRNYRVINWVSGGLLIFTGILGSSHINCFKITNALEAVPADAQIIYAEGFPANKDLYDEKLAAEALQAAKAADKVVIFAGLPDSFESEGYDRSHMRLPECQNRLIGEILEVQPNTVIVLHNGSPVEMPWINNVKGILEAYLGGQAGGAAVANILYGIVNPSG